MGWINDILHFVYCEEIVPPFDSKLGMVKSQSFLDGVECMPINLVDLDIVILVDLT